MYRKLSIGRPPTMILILLAALPATGCQDDQARHRQWVQESIQRQEKQNQQTAETARRLVEADAQPRGELVALQQQLQAERTEVGRQRDALEQDRKAIAAQRHRDPIIDQHDDN